MGDDMARGGKREGAGAPKGNQNALKHGGRAKVLYGVSLDQELRRFEYRALCMEQLEAIKRQDEYWGSTSILYLKHKERYKGAIFFQENLNKSKAYYNLGHKVLMAYASSILK
jgi:hypothetical protein